MPDVPDVDVQQGLPGFPPGPVSAAREAAVRVQRLPQALWDGVRLRIPVLRRQDGPRARAKARVESREGIDVTPEELEAMRSIVRPLIKKGQSLEVIWATRAGELPVSPSTFYRYAEMGVFGDIIGLDLPKKVRFKPRRRRADETPIPRHDLEGRAYKDFEALPDDKKMDAVEMDCVVGRRGEAQAILTLLFRRFRFQLMLFLPKHNQEEVGRALDMVEGPIGLGEFKRLFGVILTDRGSEFLDYGAIEKSCTSRGSRCRVYYCDPMKSGQKGSCEKNHVELRKVIPKGSSFVKLTPGSCRWCART